MKKWRIQSKVSPAGIALSWFLRFVASDKTNLCIFIVVVQ